MTNKIKKIKYDLPYTKYVVEKDTIPFLKYIQKLIRLNNDSLNVHQIKNNMIEAIKSYEIT